MNEVKKYLKVELGFLLIDLFIDTLIDIISSLVQSSFKRHYWHINAVLFIILFICIITIVFIFFNLTLTTYERFLKGCAISQGLYMLTIILKTVGYLADFIPKYWNRKWITIFNGTKNLLVPFITLFIVLYELSMKEKNFLQFFKK